MLIGRVSDRKENKSLGASRVHQGLRGGFPYIKPAGVILPAITTVAERVLQRAIEEYRLQRPELVRTEFHSRSLEGIAGQLEQEIAGY